MAENLSITEILWQRRNRLKRILKRRLTYFSNWLVETSGVETETLNVANTDASNEVLKEGDVVRVRSREEIQTTLNKWNQLKNCSFMEEMWPYCGTTQTVFKKVEKFLDERDYLLKKCSGIFLLEGVICEGTKDFGPCDRACYFFWREEWLKKN